MDEIDRILSSDEIPEPSSGFVASVMAALEGEKALPPPIPFPWWRVAAGTVSGIAAVAISGAAGPRLVPPPVAARLVDVATAPAAVLAAVVLGSALLMTWAAVRVSLRLLTSPR